jgi:hypothetical protein
MVTMKTLLLAIDPGSSGAIAVLWPGKPILAYAMPDDPDLVEMMDGYAVAAKAENYDLVGFLEEVGGYIGKPQPGSSMFKFGSGYGFIRGVLAANRIKTVLVRPQTWQKGVSGVQSTKGPERKRALKEAAARLYPDIKVTLTNADALLIADYGYKQLQHV